VTKVAIVGAGSLVFTRKIVNDLLQQDVTADAEIHLVDIDPYRLERAQQAIERLGARAGREIPIVVSEDCATGVRGCDYVVNAIQVGGKEATLVDFDIPEKFGVRQTIADTHGIGGISRALRTIPPVLEIAHAVEDNAPDAWFLNYTNPMAMVVMALARGTGTRHVGLCHGTEHTVSTIAGYLGTDRDSLAWQAAGINHMTWVLSLSAGGHDLYPQLREFARNADLDNHDDAVRLELLQKFAYFPSESSVHNAEYYPWFLRPDAPVPCGVRAREYLFRLDNLERNFVDEQSASAEAEAGAPPPAQSEEYAPRVIAALEGNRLYRFMGNVVNAGGMIANLPLDCCVEVPCYIDGGAIVPGVIGRLPEQCAALNRTAINVQLLTVMGILERRKDTIYQAALLDPLLSAQLSTDETVALVDELVSAHGNPSGLQ
jgi:alpha-galactosidase